MCTFSCYFFGTGVSFFPGVFLFIFFRFLAGNQLGAQVQVQVRLLVDFAYRGLNFLCLGPFSHFFHFIIFFLGKPNGIFGVQLS